MNMEVISYFSYFYNTLLVADMSAKLWALLPSLKRFSWTLLQKIYVFLLFLVAYRGFHEKVPSATCVH